VLFASGAITFYEGNNMLSALAKYVMNRLIHGLFHIALVISPRLIKRGLISRAIYMYEKGHALIYKYSYLFT
jgi:hypothetical protein